MAWSDAAARRRYHVGNLRAQLLEEARAILDQGGLAQLNLRALASRTGIAPGSVYHHYAGKAELLALEHVRVDAADGSLDGQLAKEKLKTNVNQKASGTTSEALYRAATKGARKLYDAKPQYGGALKYFMLYDFFVLCTCCAGYAFIILSNGYFRRGVGQNTFMFSVTLFFLKVSL